MIYNTYYISCSHCHLYRYYVEKVLIGERNGSFLVRKSGRENKEFIISITKGESVKHIKITYSDGKYGFSIDQALFGSIIELVKYHQIVPLAQHNPQLDWITLAHPISGYNHKVTLYKMWLCPK